MTTRAAILARVSDDQGGRSASVAEQLAACRAACAELGWAVAAEHADSDISASRFGNGKERPGWEALKRDIASGAVNAVCLWETSRASREMADWAGFLNLCRSGRAAICVVMHGSRVYDTALARDRRSLMEDGTDAEYESEKASERVTRGVHGALAAGKPMASVPFGYRKVRDPANGKITGLEIDPAKAGIVRRIFADVASGVPVAHAARAAGMPRQNVLFICRNPAYIARRKLADGSYVGCGWDPIVDGPLFWQAQQELASHRLAGQRPGSYRSLLAFLATCGKCGDPVTCETRKGVRGYRCRKGCLVYRDAGEADQSVAAAVIWYLEQPGVLERWSRDSGPEAAAAEAEAARLEGKLDDAVTSYNADRIGIAELEKISAEVKPRIAAARDRARTLSVPPALQRFAAERLGRNKAAIEIWNDMPLAARRDLVRDCARVRFHPAGAEERLEIITLAGPGPLRPVKDREC